MINILYEDNHLLVVDKPANMPSQRDNTHDIDLQSYLKTYLREKYDKPGNVFLALVHRLDRPASGIMVLARTSKAASRLAAEVRERKLSRVYQAVISGECPPEGELVHFLTKDRIQNKVKITGQSDGGAKKAVLKYRRLGMADGLSLIEIKLITGRPHQIRVQFAAVGAPLWGDMKYGDLSGAGQSAAGNQPNPPAGSAAVSHRRTDKKTPPGKAKPGSGSNAGHRTPHPQYHTSGLALRSMQITFTHPVRRESMSFSVSLPCRHPWSLFKKSR